MDASDPDQGTTESGDKRAAKKARWPRRLFVLAAVAFGIYALVGFFVVPRVVKG